MEFEYLGEFNVIFENALGYKAGVQGEMLEVKNLVTLSLEVWYPDLMLLICLGHPKLAPNLPKLAAILTFYK